MDVSMMHQRHAPSLVAFLFVSGVFSLFERPAHGNRVCGGVIVATSQIDVMWMELVLVVSETGSTASPDNM